MKELIEKIKNDYYEDITYGEDNRLGIGEILTKHLSDKVIVEKKVLEEMIEKRKQCEYDVHTKYFVDDLQSLLDNQE